jgi:hypothetical protein
MTDAVWFENQWEPERRTEHATRLQKLESDKSGELFEKNHDHHLIPEK